MGFRDWIVRKARALGLAGWVRNRSYDSLEIVASGDGDAVEQLVQAAHQGPPFASVSDVRVEDAEGEGSSGFVRRPTL